MDFVRRAVLAVFLCAASLLAAPVQASPDMRERESLREVLSQRARAARDGVVKLPLPARRPARASAASASGELARIARSNGPERILVGLHSHADLRGVADELRVLGARPERFDLIGVVAATVPSGAAAAAALRGDPRVAYVERDKELQLAADPFDSLDPETGMKHTWFFDEVRAGEALAAVGGGSRRTVAIIDTGLDVGHAEFAGQVQRSWDATGRGGKDVTDFVGHGTFVAGLISALDGNGIGAKGVAGRTKLIAVRASRDGNFHVTDLLRGMQYAIRRGADIINFSLAGEGFDDTQARALEVAFYNDVLPVAAAGNNALDGNPIEYPAAAIGGPQGGRGIGLSVAATNPGGRHADFSNHNDFVGVSAPGGSDDCRFGVFSTLPNRGGTEWDRLDECMSRLKTDAGQRFAYGQGTSFAAPIVSGLAALAWQAEPDLASEQVAEVLVQSANPGDGWNEYTGAGVVDGLRAVEVARRYDVIGPRARGRARRRGNRVRVTVGRSRDRTHRGDELVGGVTYALLLSRDGGRSFSVVTSGRPRPFSRSVRIRGRRTNLLAVTACDRNGNCGVKRFRRFRRR
jgi:Subtilase family